MSSRSAGPDARRVRRSKRVLLKISGECFADPKLLATVVDQVVRVRRQRVELAVVVGGGNILRGRDTHDLDRATADRAGMLATVINGIRLAAVTGARTPTRHLAARGIPGIAEGYSVETGRRALAAGELLVLSGGTGNPFFSTDSAAALRAAELDTALILKGTNVTGVYSADPHKNPDARLYRKLSYERALTEKLHVMDLTAFALCMENRIPIVVFDISRPRAIIDIIEGKRIGSRVC